MNSAETDSQGAIMISMPFEIIQADKDNYDNASLSSSDQTSSLPDVLNSNELKSLELTAENGENLSFRLLDAQENLVIENAEIFAKKLGRQTDSEAKVLSIIGNTGEGKSHTLNHSLFEGREVFKTSPNPESCTIGVWAAYQPTMQLVVLDTEGMLGFSVNENQRTRLLLKVLAASDVVIFKTRAARLGNDMFRFLGDASKAFNDHFSQELKSLSGAVQTSNFGPSVIVCHERNFTNIVSETDSNSSDQTIPEQLLKQKLAQLGQDVSAFSNLRYIGVNLGDENTVKSHFVSLNKMIGEEMKQQPAYAFKFRAHREIKLIYKVLQRLTEKFNSDLPSNDFRSFPDEYFTCQTTCQSCQKRCTKPIHYHDAHKTEERCVYSKKLDNKIYLCQKCYLHGRKEVVVLKSSSAQDGALLGLATFAWSGSVLECSTCGIIYRGRENWYGNPDPEATNKVHAEIKHIWPGTRTLQGTSNAARKVLDGMTMLSSTVSSLSAAPSKMVTNWISDQIAPNYWRPNADINECYACKSKFNDQERSIHHCRACGEGFCGKCSSKKSIVSDRGWGDEPVRVCDSCYEYRKQNGNLAHFSEASEVQARKYGEKTIDTLNHVVSALGYSMTVIKDSARPSYWVPDDEITECFVCETKFKDEQTNLKIHHCRACGQGVCDPCSKTLKPVAIRGWDNPVRVCDKCI